MKIHDKILHQLNQVLHIQWIHSLNASYYRHHDLLWTFLRHPSMDMHQKKKSSTLLQNQSYHLKHKDYNQKNTNPFNAFKSKLNRKINQSY